MLHALKLVRAQGILATCEPLLIGLGLDLNPIELLSSVQVWVIIWELLERLCTCTPLFLVFYNLMGVELVLPSKKLHVQKLVNQVTNNFPVPQVQVLRLAISCNVYAKLLEVVDHLGERLAHGALKILVGYKNTELS